MSGGLFNSSETQPALVAQQNNRKSNQIRYKPNGYRTSSRVSRRVTNDSSAGSHLSHASIPHAAHCVTHGSSVESQRIFVTVTVTFWLLRVRWRTRAPRLEKKILGMPPACTRCTRSTMSSCFALIVVCAILALFTVHAAVTEPSNCSPARGRIRSSAFSSIGQPATSSGRQRTAASIYNADSVSVVLVYNGDETELPVHHEGSTQHYDVAIPETQSVAVASAHLELRDKKNASLVFERTQSVAFWILPRALDTSEWRPKSDDIDLMVKLSQHLKGRWQLHDAMQASHCAFERVMPRTFQSVMARLEFISALAALSPSQQPHVKEALDLATQLQVQRASSC